MVGGGDESRGSQRNRVEMRGGDALQRWFGSNERRGEDGNRGVWGLSVGESKGRRGGGGGTKTNCTMSHLLNFDKTKILFLFFFMRMETKVSLSHT